MSDRMRQPDGSVMSFTRAWVESSKHVSRGMGHFYRGMVEANRAFLSSTNGDHPETREVELDCRSADDAFRAEEWTVEQTTQVEGEVTVGDSVQFTKQLTEDDVRAFAEISGDTNRLHLSSEFAAKTRFGQQIVHGTLISSLISAALARLPGLTVYLSQDLEFTKPASLGESLTADCEVVEELGDGRYRLTTVVEAEDGTTVIDGEAVVLIDDLPAETTSIE